MKSFKYTLIIDGNYWLYKTLFTAKKIENKAFDFSDERLEENKNLLVWKLCTDLSSEIKRLSDVVEDVVYCIDGSSWRKYYFDKNELDGGAKKYKDNRKKSDEFDWDKIFKIHEEVFVKGLKDAGVKVMRLDGCEGDDLIFGWSEYLNSLGKNCLILSSDKDLIQLVDLDEANDSNTVYLNKTKDILYAPVGFREYLEKVDELMVFDIINMPKTVLVGKEEKERLKKVFGKFKIEEVDTFDFKLEKILRGDAGDNVSPVLEWECVYKSGAKKGKVYTKSITSKQVKAVLDSVNKKFKNKNELLFWDEGFINYVCHKVCEVTKFKNFNLEMVKKNFEDNRNLCVLHLKSIPEHVFNFMMDEIEKMHKKTKKVDINKLKDKDFILEKTKINQKDLNRKITSKFGMNATFFDNFDLED